MPAVPLNYLAILASIVASIVLGFLWFGPLFGKQWMASLGITTSMEELKKQAKEKGMGKTYALMTLGTVLFVFVMAHSVVFGSEYLGITGVSAGLQAGFWNWLGFVVPVSMGSVLWDNKPWKYWFITAGYYLAQFCMVGVILSVWPA